MDKKPQTIYINGPSSSGKTTLAKALQECLFEPFLHISIDRMIALMPDKMNDWTGGPAPLGFSWKTTHDANGNLVSEILLGPYARKITDAFKEFARTLLKQDFNLIIDDVAQGKKEVDLWRKALKSFPVLWVGLKPSLKALEERERIRGDRMLGSARHQAETTHTDIDYDLVLDTSSLSLDECITLIKNCL